MSHSVILLSILVHFPILLFSQTDSSAVKQNYWADKSLSVSYQHGYIFKTNRFVRGENISSMPMNRFQAFSFRFAKQTMGRKTWEQIYRYPKWGGGLYVSDFRSPNELGVPIALFGFVDAPFVRWEKSTFNYELAFGLSCNWKPYHPIRNKYNIAIGADIAFYIDVGLNYRFAISRQFDVAAGFTVTHFSNGALKVPNFGINTVAPKVSVIYNVKERPKFISQPLPQFKPYFEWEISTFVGMKNIVFTEPVLPDIAEQYEGLFFPVLGVTTAAHCRVSRKSKVGIGANVLLNSTVNAQAAALTAVDSDDFDPMVGPLGDKIQLSLFLSYELVMNRMSLTLQPAYYVYRKPTGNQTPAFHQRIGLKYRLADNIFIGMTLRSYSFYVSDFVEWSLGYRFNSDK